MQQTYLVKGPAVAENEINRALDKAIIEVVETLVIIKSVLIPIKTAVIKCSLGP